MTLELLVLSAAFVTGAIVSSVMGVLLKRELEAVFDETLNSVAREIR